MHITHVTKLPQPSPNPYLCIVRTEVWQSCNNLVHGLVSSLRITNLDHGNISQTDVQSLNKNSTFWKKQMA